MLSTAQRIAIIAASALIMSLGGTLVARSADPEAPTCPKQSVIIADCSLDEGGDPGTPSPGTRPGGRRTLCHKADGSPTACVDPYGWGVWSNAEQCFIRREEPQPSYSDPAWAHAWRGRTTGAIFMCWEGGYVGRNVWMPTIDPDASLMAHNAVAQLRLEAINIGIAPLPKESDPASMGYVGRQVWMWAESPSSTTYGPKSITATDGPYTVGLSAKVTKIVWNMGDGKTVTCRNPGTKWTQAKATNNAPSPTCGHVYEREGTYNVSATSYWQVSWNTTGQSGTIDLTLTRSVHVVIGELQVVRTR